MINKSNKTLSSNKKDIKAKGSSSYLKELELIKLDLKKISDESPPENLNLIEDWESIDRALSSPFYGNKEEREEAQKEPIARSRSVPRKKSNKKLSTSNLSTSNEVQIGEPLNNQLITACKRIENIEEIVIATSNSLTSFGYPNLPTGISITAPIPNVISNKKLRYQGQNNKSENSRIRRGIHGRSQFSSRRGRKPYQNSRNNDFYDDEGGNEQAQEALEYQRDLYDTE